MIVESQGTLATTMGERSRSLTLKDGGLRLSRVWSTSRNEVQASAPTVEKGASLPRGHQYRM